MQEAPTTAKQHHHVLIVDYDIWTNADIRLHDVINKYPNVDFQVVQTQEEGLEILERWREAGIEANIICADISGQDNYMDEVEDYCSWITSAQKERQPKLFIMAKNHAEWLDGAAFRNDDWRASTFLLETTLDVLELTGKIEATAINTMSLNCLLEPNSFAELPLVKAFGQMLMVQSAYTHRVLVVDDDILTQTLIDFPVLEIKERYPQVEFVFVRDSGKAQQQLVQWQAEGLKPDLVLLDVNSDADTRVHTLLRWHKEFALEGSGLHIMSKNGSVHALLSIAMRPLIEKGQATKDFIGAVTTGSFQLLLEPEKEPDDELVQAFTRMLAPAPKPKAIRPFRWLVVDDSGAGMPGLRDVQEALAGRLEMITAVTMGKLDEALKTGPFDVVDVDCNFGKYGGKAAIDKLKAAGVEPKHWLFHSAEKMDAGKFLDYSPDPQKSMAYASKEWELAGFELQNMYIDNNFYELRVFLNRQLGTDFCENDGQRFLYSKNTKTAQQLLEAIKSGEHGEVVTSAIRDYAHLLSELLVTRIDSFEQEATSARMARFKDVTGNALQGYITYSAEGAAALRKAGKKAILCIDEFKAGTSTDFLNGIDGLIIKGEEQKHLDFILKNQCLSAVWNMVEGGKLPEEGAAITIGPEEGSELGGLYSGHQPTLAVDDAVKEVVLYARYARGCEPGARFAMYVKANIDNAEEGIKALKDGADGIALWRTEHLFTGSEGHALLQALLKGERFALKSFVNKQYREFRKLLEKSDGKPVTIRLLDAPPEEFNLDTNLRGVQLGVAMPEIYMGQILAIVHAVKQSRTKSELEVLVPLVRTFEELQMVKAMVDKVNHEYNCKLKLGSMLETPEACKISGQLATICSGLSIGGNDLVHEVTGLKFGDNGTIHDWCAANQHAGKGPFHRLPKVVENMVAEAVKQAQSAQPYINISMCGRQAVDLGTAEFCHNAGIDTISVSPADMNMALIASARAQLRNPRDNKFMTAAMQQKWQGLR